MSTVDLQAPSVFRDERVMLYPSFATFLEATRTWRIYVAGSVLRPNHSRFQRRVLTRLIQRLMKASEQDLQSEVFERRLSGFLVLACRGRKVSVQLGDRVIPLSRPSRRNGHFREILEVAARDCQEVLQWGMPADGALTLQAREHDQPGPAAWARVQLLAPEGLSVISDVDDTIKHSDVPRRRILLRNTFLRPFRTVPGMVDLYGRWAERGAAFHYVSSSPWQLYGSLAELVEEAGFPEGSFHLRQLRLRDSSLFRWIVIRRRPKAQMIRSLLRLFPRRRFILMGDSGERDPEIYGAMAREFPDQVQRIFIRQLNRRPLEGERLRKAFRSLDPPLWQIFRSPAEITD